MKNIKVTFENGHVINHKGTTDDIELFDKISQYELSLGNHIGLQGYDTTLEYKVEVLKWTLTKS